MLGQWKNTTSIDSTSVYAPESANTASQYYYIIQTIDYRRVDFCCPQATGQFWTAFLFPAVKDRLETGPKAEKDSM
jgi:hypothetical protein